MFGTIFLFVVGFLFFLAGIMALCKSKMSLEMAPFLIFPVAGAGIMFFTIVYNVDILALEPVRDHVDDILSVCVMAFTIFVGVVLFLSNFLDKKYKKKYCTYALEACCVDQGETDSDSVDCSTTDSKMYSPIWSYTYRGKEYLYKSSYAASITPPEQGSIHTIYIDPDHPEKVWIPRYSHHNVFIVIGILAIVLGMVGGYAVLFLRS